MHKFITSVALLLVATSIATAMSVDELKKMQMLIANCIATEGASDDDAADMMLMKVPTTTAGMCLHACLMETSGVIVDGKFNAANAIAAARVISNDDAAKMALAVEITNECAAKMAGGDPDRCVYAKKVVECNTQGALDRGATQKDLLTPN